jgi:chromate transporter
LPAGKSHGRPAMNPPPGVPPVPSLRTALRFWLWLGCVSFGGPAGQIAIMQRELVERRRWIGSGHFLHALNYCMILPGPEAQQLATYLGWRMHGWRGGVAAGALFVLPCAVLLFFLAWLYMEHGSVSWVAALFYGLSAAVIAVVAAAVLRIGGKALRSPALWALAVLSFAAIRFGQVPFVIILAVAALAGWAGHRWAPQLFPSGGGHGGGGKTEAPCAVLPPSPRATWRRTGMVLAVCLLLWWVPVLLAGWWLGFGSRTFALGTFFSQAALVTFGGAYAVLPYVSDHAVGSGWLTRHDMMSGLALAETTPGPLIMVLQFAGFVAGWNLPPSGMSPLAGAAIGAAITTWATFLPCFLFIFLGGPHVEGLRARPQISAALAAITAAVTGVILNMGLQFAEHALWPAGSAGCDWFIAGLAVAAFAAVHWCKAGLIPVIGLCALAGVAWRMLV